MTKVAILGRFLAIFAPLKMQLLHNYRADEAAICWRVCKNIRAMVSCTVSTPDVSYSLRKSILEHKTACFVLLQITLYLDIVRRFGLREWIQLAIRNRT